MTDPRQAAYAAKRAEWRADHPIGPFVAPDALVVAFAHPVETIDTAAMEEAARVTRLKHWQDDLTARGLWG